jgi:hypothetical protein
MNTNKNESSFQVRTMIDSNFLLKALKKSFEKVRYAEKMRIRCEIILLYIFVLRTSNHA